MPNQHRAYSPAETAWLKAHYATATQVEIMEAVPGRSWTNIQNHASKQGAAGREKFVPKLAVTSWTPAHVAVLLAHYPREGSAAVSALTGLTRVAVRAEASRRKLAYVSLGKRPKPAKVAKPKAVKTAKPVKPRQLMAPKVKPPVRVPKVKVNPSIVPLRRPDGQPLLAVKRSAGTPNLNLAKEARRRKEEAPVRAALITADEVKKLPYNHPGRMAYCLDGVRGWQRWKAGA